MGCYWEIFCRGIVSATSSWLGLIQADFTQRHADEEPAEGPKITEEERLAVVVQMIDMETAIAPKGALSMRSSGAILPNPAFQGAYVALIRRWHCI